MSHDCLKPGQDPDLCTEFCCTRDDNPTWLSLCCGESASMDYNPCQYTDEGECECGCCWSGGGDENAPAMVGGGFGGGSGGGGNNGGGDWYGPPIKGPDGDGMFPWEIGPLPYQPAWPDRLPEIGSVPVNSIKYGYYGANIHGSMSQTGIGLTHFNTKRIGVRNTLMGWGGLPYVTTLIGGLIKWICSEITKSQGRYFYNINQGGDPDPCLEDLLDCLCSVCLFTGGVTLTMAMMYAIIGLIGGSALIGLGGVIVWSAISVFAMGAIFSIICHLVY